MVALFVVNRRSFRSKVGSLLPYWLCESLLLSGVQRVHIQVARLLRICYRVHKSPCFVLKIIIFYLQITVNFAIVCFFVIAMLEEVTQNYCFSVTLGPFPYHSGQDQLLPTRFNCKTFLSDFNISWCYVWNVLLSIFGGLKRFLNKGVHSVVSLFFLSAPKNISLCVRFLCDSRCFSLPDDSPQTVMILKSDLFLPSYFRLMSDLTWFDWSPLYWQDAIIHVLSMSLRFTPPW